MLKQYQVLLGAVALALMSGCGFLQQEYDPTDDGQFVTVLVVEEAAFAGCEQLAEKQPEIAARVALGIDQAVIPLLAGDKPDLAQVRIELNKLLGANEARYLGRAVRALEKLAERSPGTEPGTLYAVALEGLVDSCREGLSVSTAAWMLEIPLNALVERGPSRQCHVPRSEPLAHFDRVGVPIRQGIPLG